MKISRAALAALCLTATVVAGLGAPSSAYAGPHEERRLTNVTRVLSEAQRMPDFQVPDWLLQRAQGIAVIPDVVKAAIGIGGRGGRGVLVVREPNGSWSNPSFITLAGGSIGWQAGVQASDIILVFTTRRSVEGITGGKVTLGADASVAAGPIGRSVSGGTDATFSAEVYSYSRAKGLFGGIAIDGSVIAIDRRSNETYYGKAGVLASEIFSGATPPPPASAQTLKTAIQRLGSGVAIAPSTATPAAAGTSAAAPAGAPGTRPATTPTEERGLESGGAATFPLDGDKPKNEPPR
jgi:lipid-binding SYLF domain-containing protein